jgi:hypothetical protein
MNVANRRKRYLQLLEIVSKKEWKLEDKVGISSIYLCNFLDELGYTDISDAFLNIIGGEELTLKRMSDEN